MTVKLNSGQYDNCRMDEATKVILFCLLNLKHDNYLTNYSKTLLQKLTVINNRVSQFPSKTTQELYRNYTYFTTGPAVQP